ncbi:S66 family peptidase [Streptococcus caprae]|uniref:S66 peptidase family protein n=1 Tax=Streptococcus caprae TaxID=1640501 RepID=A0ABV8CSY9_9STRE
MIKTVGIVSLSSGTLGEDFVKHELDLGIQRLEDMGLTVSFMPHALEGIEELKAHPEKRAKDLLQAFQDDAVDMILCAIGGDDTYRLLPYLFEDDQLKQVLTSKVFLGFSDTTMNHLMLHKLGLKTFYGQSFLADVCELDEEMLPYSAAYFQELVDTRCIREIRPSQVWYEAREDYSEQALGTKRVSHRDRGFELLQGPAQFSGPILGGCLESLFDIFDNSRYADSIDLCQPNQLFPSLEDWQGKILLLETSEERPEPELYRKMLEALKQTGIFEVLNGVLVGKPEDEIYDAEYKKILQEVIDTDIPILYNLNVGHATPRAIVPFGVIAHVDADEQVIRFEE